LEKFENFEVQFEFVWNAHKIYKNKPDLVIVPNSRGNLLYKKIAQYSFENNILVFSHDSEGNFNTEFSYDFLGYNQEGTLYCPIQYTWNQRVKDFLIEKYNFPENKIYVSGAPGFDKYKFLPLKDKNSILKKYNLSHFTKIAGYAGWAFGKLYNEELNDVLNIILKPGEEGKKWLENQRDIVEECLRKAIEQFPDVLFILKKHPRENFESDYRDSRNEMNQLIKYDNVLYLKDEEEIQDLIEISDIWLAFESTSIMEAWLLGKPTLIINSDCDFKRAEIYKGSAIVQNPNELIDALSKLFIENDLAYFNNDNFLNIRKEIIEDSIGFSDGLNHLRIGKSFKCFINKQHKSNTKITLNFKFLRLYLLLHIGKIFYFPWLFKRLPKFKKTVWVFENYSLAKIKESKKNIYPYLDTFYKEYNLNEKIENNEIWDEL
jgi:surface carbohydrate biosynthesis protein